MIIAVPRETFPGERRVAMIPASVPVLIKSGMEVWIEKNAGLSAGYPDDQYEAKGAKIVPERDSLFAADVLFQVRAAGANPVAGQADLSRYRAGQIVIASADPLNCPKESQELAAKGVTLFSLELLPRITRGQSMDVLSSMATIAGYRAVLLAADRMTKIFPMLMTAAGTVTAARVFVIGAGVAGLQAIATAKRLGAVVSAYDVRPAVKEQIQSLGGKFIELELETSKSEDQGGYAQQMDDEFYRKQRALLAKVASESDAIITTAAIPGKKSPVLITAEAVRGMAPGSVIIDLAAERGGNCELTKCGETVVENGVTILGPANLASDLPTHASLMYSKNLCNFAANLIKKGNVEMNMDDEIIRDTLVCRDGQVVNPRIQQLLS
ncbi:MAG: Re/Si-specific NAD(P)(+) transhydrogenase subunit alpha [Planctomycetaceae bacterium]|nr:Re/Si-specific NAD(P)(+) transhydrogenase subunit alpha [Planctomycetaceae bacterium]